MSSLNPKIYALQIEKLSTRNIWAADVPLGRTGIRRYVYTL